MRTLFVVLVTLVMLTLGVLEVITAHSIPKARPLPTRTMTVW
jgi:hypothetical protein